MNIGRLLAPIDDPMIADFVAQLDEVNALAERSKGFVWRLQSDSGNATDVAYNDDPLVIVNMSVWESIEALREYVYASNHATVLRRRGEWFEKLSNAHSCLWWVPTGHVPTVTEARERLEHFQDNGASERAFWFSRPYAAVE